VSKSRPTSFDARVIRGLGRLERLVALQVPGRRAALWFGGVVLGLFVVNVLASGVFLNSHTADFFFMLETSWRLQNGQVPCTDFPTPIGPVFYGMIWLTGALFGHGPGALIHTPLLLAAPVSAGVLAIAWQRMNPVFAFGIAVFVLLNTVSPRFVDEGFVDLSFLAYYNKFSWLLVAPILIGALFPRRLPAERPQAAAEGAFLGACLVALVFLKINYGVVGAGALIAGAVLNANVRRSTGVALAVAAAVGGLVALTASGWLAAYVGDVQSVAAANDLGQRWGMKSQSMLRGYMPLLYASLAAIWLIEQYRKGDPSAWPDVGAVLVLFGANYGLAFNDHGDYPVLICLLFLRVHLAAQDRTLPLRGAAGAAYRQAKLAFTVSPLLVVVGWVSVNDAGSIAWHTVGSWLAPSVPWDSPAPRIGELAINNGTNPQTPEGNLVRSIGDGLSLVREHGLEDRTILVGDRINVMPYLLNAPPPKGTLAWFDIGRTFSATAHPDPDVLFADVEVVMIHRQTVFPATRNLFTALYQDELDSRYALVDETDDWILYAR